MLCVCVCSLHLTANEKGGKLTFAALSCTQNRLKVNAKRAIFKLHYLLLSRNADKGNNCVIVISKIIEVIGMVVRFGKSIV